MQKDAEGLRGDWRLTPFWGLSQNEENRRKH